MDRMANVRLRIVDDRATRMFQQMLTHWAADLIRTPASIDWPAADPMDDYQDRDWSKLYAGSVLDD